MNTIVTILIGLFLLLLLITMCNVLNTLRYLIERINHLESGLTDVKQIVTKNKHGQ